MTVYQADRQQAGICIVTSSRVKSWEGWPDDVRETLRHWNCRRALSFRYTHRLFKCPDCERFIDPAGTAACHLHESFICDDCIIDRARMTADPPQGDQCP
jgi:hypothetical protein